MVGASAVSMAVYLNHVDCVRALVRGGADVSIRVAGQSLEQVADGHKKSAGALKAALRLPAEKGDNKQTCKAPSVVAPAPAVKKQYCCAQCGTTTSDRKKMQTCSVCKTAYYCNRRRTGGFTSRCASSGRLKSE